MKLSVQIDRIDHERKGCVNPEAKMKNIRIYMYVKMNSCQIK